MSSCPEVNWSDIWTSVSSVEATLNSYEKILVFELGEKKGLEQPLCISETCRSCAILCVCRPSKTDLNFAFSMKLLWEAPTIKYRTRVYKNNCDYSLEIGKIDLQPFT